MKKLIGPFTQILPLTGLAVKGALKDEDMRIIPQGGVLVENGLIVNVDTFEKLYKENLSAQIEEIKGQQCAASRFCRLPYAYLFCG